MAPSLSREAATLERLRRLLLAVVALAMLGTLADLVLLAHYEDPWQWTPILLLVLGVCVAAWTGLSRSRAATSAMRVVMVLLLAAGAVGVALHYEGNSEFQQEMDPSLSGWPLFVKVVRAKAPPALAPASLTLIGLLGLLSTYGAPRAAGSAGSGPSLD